MGKKKKQQEEQEEKSVASYYQLKTDAVERLVNAKNAPEVSYAEIRKYTKRGKFRIPEWLKVVLVKFWFSGAICYFFLWGLGLYIQGLDLMFALAVGLGAANDLLVNRALRFLEPTDGEFDKWKMVTVRKFWSIFINVLYSGLVLYCVFQTYYAVNTLLGVDANAGAGEAEAMLGVEPILFGLLYMGFDMLLIKIKHTFIKIFRDAGANISGGKK
ncbi:MAG: hypothetical protein J1F60_10990 [Oscillospiraceae bacterium]|nr:hypothetical protein [Oscillospiraceae bacterium]